MFALSHKLVALLLVALLANPTCCCAIGTNVGPVDQVEESTPAAPEPACPACAQLAEDVVPLEGEKVPPSEKPVPCACACDDDTTSEKARFLAVPGGYELPALAFAEVQQNQNPAPPQLEDIAVSPTALPPPVKRCVLYSRFLR